MAEVVRQLRWTAVCVLLSALCTAHLHGADRGESWWWPFLAGLVGALTGLLHPKSAPWQSLLITAAMGAGALLGAEPTAMLFGVAIAGPVPWIVGGFRLQAQRVNPSKR